MDYPNRQRRSRKRHARRFLDGCLHCSARRSTPRSLVLFPESETKSTAGHATDEIKTTTTVHCYEALYVLKSQKQSRYNAKVITMRAWRGIPCYLRLRVPVDAEALLNKTTSQVGDPLPLDCAGAQESQPQTVRRAPGIQENQGSAPTNFRRAGTYICFDTLYLNTAPPSKQPHSLQTRNNQTSESFLSREEKKTNTARRWQQQQRRRRRRGWWP